MGIEVLGHQLPPVLVKLIEEGKWGNRQYLPTPLLNMMLAKAGLRPVELDMDMDSVETMVRETTGAKIPYIDDPEERLRMSERYSQASSKELGHEVKDDGIIDIDKTIFIAGNHDEDVLCLDYRNNPENPHVIAWIRAGAWTKIAPDFETFARELGLVE
jgi:hypothetical protein